KGSTQIVKLAAAVRAFTLFKAQPLNVVADSLYVTGIIQRLEQSFLKTLTNEQLFLLLKQLLFLLEQREHDYFVLHVHSHTNLPGPIAQGNRVADHFTAAVLTPNTYQQAKLSHDFFHQNAKALQKTYITRDQAQNIIQSCPDCQDVSLLPAYSGINPRGLQPCSIWQTDITHYPSFGRLKYVHVSVDTFSHYAVATAHVGEKHRDVCRHWLACFTVMGVPTQIKTDNGPAYTAQSSLNLGPQQQRTRAFLQTWGVTHVTGIPHSPTGQAIVEHTHRTLKEMLEKQ
ncbi:POK6 protein, partial [Casuarius casuarius]|nr:POK6 protein [Casuarius casuarius]